MMNPSRFGASVSVVAVVTIACSTAAVVVPRARDSGPLADCVPSLRRAGGKLRLPPGREPLLGHYWIRASDTNELVRLDPVSLRPMSKPVPLGNQNGEPFGLSPDSSRLAIGDMWGLRVIDVEEMELLDRMPLGGRYMAAVAWLSDDRIVAIVSDRGPPYSNDVVFLDPEGLEEVGREPLDGVVIDWARLDDVLVALMRPPYGEFGPSRLVAIDSGGQIETALLREIPSGSQDAGDVPRDVVPGMAIDPQGRRAFVMMSDGPVAEIDLAGMDVDYHFPDSSRSLFSDLAAWLVGTASAKMSDSSVTTAEWMGGGLLAVSGRELSFVRRGRQVRPRVDHSGVRVIGTRDWTGCILDRDASDIAVARDLLLTYHSCEEVGDRRCGGGVTAYGRDGSERWHVLRRSWVDIQVGEDFAYVTESSSGWRVSVVDLSSGRIVNELRHRPPQLIE